MIKLLLLGIFLCACTNLEELKKSDFINSFFKNRKNYQLTDKVYTLEECIQVALQNNFELKAQKLQKEITKIKKMSFWELFKLNLSQNYSSRSNSPGATSIGVEDGLQSLRASRSSSKNTTTSQARLSFDLIDFSNFYLTSSQEENKERLQNIVEKKTKNSIKMEVIRAYYQLASFYYISEKVEKEIVELDKKVEVYSTDKTISRKKKLEIIEKLLRAKKSLANIKKLYYEHSFNLCSLLGVLPKKNVKLDTSMFEVKTSDKIFKFSLESKSLDDWIRIALNNRPEIEEAILEYNNLEVEKAKTIRRLFPSLSVFASYDETDNKFLVNQNWISFGYNFVIDLLSIPKRLNEKNIIVYQKELRKIRLLSTSLLSISQIAIASENLLASQKEIRLEERLNSVKKQRYELLQKSGTNKKLDLLEAELAYLFAEYDKVTSIANYYIYYQEIAYLSNTNQFQFYNEK